MSSLKTYGDEIVQLTAAGEKCHGERQGLFVLSTSKQQQTVQHVHRPALSLGLHPDVLHVGERCLGTRKVANFTVRSYLEFEVPQNSPGPFFGE